MLFLNALLNKEYMKENFDDWVKIINDPELAL